MRVSSKNRGKYVPVLLKLNSTNRGNCTECFHSHHLAPLGVISANLTKHCVVL
jgi:hypothetical protein